MTALSPLDGAFFEQVIALRDGKLKLRWYYCVIVNLAAINYPELIPQVWEHCWEHLCEQLSFDDRFKVAQKVREAITKACGIMGPAKAGTAIRILAKSIPRELDDTESRRAKEDHTTASARGHAFHRRIYINNADFDISATPSASPDYSFVVRDLLYGYVFSFPDILDDVETGFVIVATLIGLDCQYQLRNQMKGILYSGGKREEIEQLRGLCLDVERRCGLRLKGDVAEVPHI